MGVSYRWVLPTDLSAGTILLLDPLPPHPGKKLDPEVPSPLAGLEPLSPLLESPLIFWEWTLETIVSFPRDGESLPGSVHPGPSAGDPQAQLTSLTLSPSPLCCRVTPGAR